jgi:hypothetical protein
VVTGLCIAIRQRFVIRAEDDAALESLPSPREADVAHVKVTLKHNLKNKSAAEKGSEAKYNSNSGSHEMRSSSMGGHSDMRISALPAGAAGSG